MSSLVLIGVLNFNRATDLERLLLRLLAIKEQSYRGGSHIVVIDNGSTDRSREVLNSFSTRGVEAVLLDENLGGAGGFQYLQELALQRDYEYLWMLDDDAFPSRKFLSYSLRHLDEHPDVGVVGGQVLAQEDLRTVVECGAIVKKNGELASLYSNEHRRRSGQVYECDYVAFLSVVIRMSCLRHTGTVDSLYYLHWDDCDFGARVRAAGWRVNALSSALVAHPRFSGRRLPPSTRFYDERNHLIYIRRHMPHLLRKVYARKANYLRHQALFGDVADAVVTERAIVAGLRLQTGKVSGFISSGTPEAVMVSPLWDEDTARTVVGRVREVFGPVRQVSWGAECGGTPGCAMSTRKGDPSFTDGLLLVLPKGSLTQWHVRAPRVTVWWSGALVEVPRQYRTWLVFLLQRVSAGRGVTSRALRLAIRHSLGRMIFPIRRCRDAPCIDRKGVLRL